MKPHEIKRIEVLYMATTRAERIEQHHKNSLRAELLRMMEILEPGEKLKWGAKSSSDLVAYAAIHLALEYQAITGYPIIELLTGDRAVDDPTPSVGDVKNPGTPSGFTAPSEDALPL